ncbi:uncharacterized protein ACNS7B_015880 [Menidia menidia]
MHKFFLRAIICVSIVHVGLGDEECSEAVLARRETFYVPTGESLSLSCLVQHCEGNWLGKWEWEHMPNTGIGIVKDGPRHHLDRINLTANETRLELKITSVNQSDEGSYRCSVTWGESSGVGHWMHVNVTKAVSRPRNILHRVLICVGALFCVPVILGLAHCLSSEVKPQPHPKVQVTYAAVAKKRPRPPSRAPPQPLPRRQIPQRLNDPVQQAPPQLPKKTEVVYADISQEALRQQEGSKNPSQTTVYSSLKFS